MNLSVDFFTLGCSKNLVDSEKLIYQLESNGFRVSHDPEYPNGHIAVVNTCGFIGDAKEESIQVILELCERKKAGKLSKLYVMGCLSERYLNELTEEIPEVDKFYGKFNWTELLADLGKAYDYDHEAERSVQTPSHYAYIKISEGCNRRCAYCAIPIITGKHKSRPIEDIESEVRTLVSKGVKEFQIIAQELTYYGIDLYKRRALPELIERISDIPGVEWIRLHYAYPTDFPFELLKVIRERDNVCKYLDIALQHISTSVLESMNRHINKEDTYSLIERIRAEVPGIHLRTTMMVGFPGETDENFQELIEFVKWAKFERLGAFSYCEEDDTLSAKNFTDDVAPETKEVRLSKLMRVQQQISSLVQESKIGTTMRVIIDRIEGDYFVGRTQFDSPEVDPEVLINVHENDTLEIGEFYDVIIESSDDFDLYGRVADVKA